MGDLFLVFSWQERLSLIPRMNQSTVWYLSSERNLKEMISQWEIHMNSHPDVQEALSSERNLQISGNSSVHHQGSSEPPQDEQPSPGQEPPSPVQEQVDLTEDDPVGEEVVDLWEAEDPPDEDYVVEAATRSSISGSNPWVLYEAGIICARYEDGSIKPNFYGEKVITLREWGYLRGPQRVALRRQSIGRADWEKLPWAGHLCYLLPDLGRWVDYVHTIRRQDSTTY